MEPTLVLSWVIGMVGITTWLALFESKEKKRFKLKTYNEERESCLRYAWKEIRRIEKDVGL